MAARAAVKDGRVMAIPLHRVNQLTEMIPKTLGITLDQAAGNLTCARVRKRQRRPPPARHRRRLEG